MQENNAVHLQNLLESAKNVPEQGKITKECLKQQYADVFADTIGTMEEYHI